MSDPRDGADVTEHDPAARVCAICGKTLDGRRADARDRGPARRREASRWRRLLAAIRSRGIGTSPTTSTAARGVRNACGGRADHRPPGNRTRPPFVTGPAHERRVNSRELLGPQISSSGGTRVGRANRGRAGATSARDRPRRAPMRRATRCADDHAEH